LGCAAYSPAAAQAIGGGVLATHLIKKYSNRKLYDTTSRRYVTLEVISDLLRAGEEVRVTDQVTGGDITSTVLGQILLTRQGPDALPEPVLVDLVKERGEQLLGMVRASLELPRRVSDRARGTVGKSAVSFESRVDDVLGVGLRNLNIATAEEVHALQVQIDGIVSRLDRMESELRRRGGRRIS
jgi:polyhydroxyalkanoate synthesis repressor PhaR